MGWHLCKYKPFLSLAHFIGTLVGFSSVLFHAVSCPSCYWGGFFVLLFQRHMGAFTKQQANAWITGQFASRSIALFCIPEKLFLHFDLARCLQSNYCFPLNLLNGSLWTPVLLFSLVLKGNQSFVQFTKSFLSKSSNPLGIKNMVCYCTHSQINLCSVFTY